MFKSHGLSVGRRHTLYTTWSSMIQRCTNPNNTSFKYYGGRGITVCEQWRKFINFYNDMITTWQKGLQLDRIDNDGSYTPENCKWATRTQNLKNKRNSSKFQSSVNGVTYNKNHDKWLVTYRFDSKEEAEAYASRSANEAR